MTHPIYDINSTHRMTLTGSKHCFFCILQKGQQSLRKMSAEQSDDDRHNKVDQKMLFGIIILVIVIIGILINLIGLHNLLRQKSVFHKFLRMLAIFDIAVVSCCLWMYSLADLSPYFKKVSNVSLVY